MTRTLIAILLCCALFTTAKSQNIKNLSDSTIVGKWNLVSGSVNGEVQENTEKQTYHLIIHKNHTVETIGNEENAKGTWVFDNKEQILILNIEPDGYNVKMKIIKFIGDQLEILMEVDGQKYSMTFERLKTPN